MNLVAYIQAQKQQQTVAVDFDGVLAEHETEWHESKIGSPIQDGLRLLTQLQKKGYAVVVLTARKDTKTVRTWLKKQGFQLPVTNTKPPAVAYVDDRAVRPGSLAETLSQIEELR